MLERGRAAVIGSSWGDAYACLSAADEAEPLGVADLERLATTAYMLGRDDEFEAVLERAHVTHLDAGAARRAARCAVWVGISLALRGETGPASGWFARARRIVDGEGDCVELGYLLLPVVMHQEATRDYDAAFTTAAAAVEIAERFADEELFALVLQAQGRVRVGQGDMVEGLALMDEAMVAVTAGRLSPIVTGIVYCSVIEGCQEVYELRRAREWTAALTRWCDEQQDLVSFTGRCLMHRSEIMQLRGAWTEALEESRRAAARFEETGNHRGAAQALYYAGEVHRLRGDFDLAEPAYRAASRYGKEPQPGLALLRLAQGDTQAAGSAVRRIFGETTDALDRARLLPAYVEIMLAAGDLDDARSACIDVAAAVESRETELLRAMRSYASGAVYVAGGDAWAALVALRDALAIYEDLEMPYEVARTRALVALACRAVGDEETAVLELESARAAFDALGAAPDLARLDALMPSAGAQQEASGLTARELEVLRLIASGLSNRAIAAELVISERTVARHVSNIFGKIGISSRSAATAYAYEHDLV